MTLRYDDITKYKYALRGKAYTNKLPYILAYTPHAKRVPCA